MAAMLRRGEVWPSTLTRRSRRDNMPVQGGPGDRGGSHAPGFFQSMCRQKEQYHVQLSFDT